MRNQEEKGALSREAEDASKKNRTSSDGESNEGKKALKKTERKGGVGGKKRVIRRLFMCKQEKGVRSSQVDEEGFLGGERKKGAVFVGRTTRPYMVCSMRGQNEELGKTRNR